MHNNTYLLSSVQSIFHHGPSFHSSPAIKCTNSASFSCILTMAEYLCESMPDLAPPLFPAQQKQADQGLTLQERKRKKLYFQPWCDYFNGLMEGGGYGEILEDKGVMYLICEVDEEYYGQIKEYLGDKFESISKETVQKLIQQSKNSLPQQKRLHVGIINFATSQLKNDPFTPKVNLLSLFTGIWFRHGDSWRRYDVLKGNYPTEEDLQKMDIFILSGSTYSVNDQNQHVEKTMALIKQGLKTNKKLKVLGLCFGHQAIAKYFGGSVERRDLYSGIQVIKFNSQQTKKFPHLETLNKLNTQGYLIFQFHNDYVTAIPQNFHNLAHSKSCENEALISQDGRVMTFQFHNEYTYGYIQDFEVRIKNYFKQDLYKTDYKLRLEALEEFGVDRHIESCRVVRELVRKFMEWKVEA